MVRNDAEITEYVLENCENKFSEEFVKKLSSNSQSSRLSTKYDLIEETIIKTWNSEHKTYSEQDVKLNASKAYIYAKMISGKFTEIRPRVDSTEVLDYIISNYEDGYKYMQEAAFMKIGINSIPGYVKGKLEGNNFYTKIAGVTNSQPSTIKKETNNNTVKVSKIKNLIFEVRAKEDECRWLDSRIERTKTKEQLTQRENYNYNFA